MFRKLVEDDKIDEQKYNSDGQAIGNELLDVQLQDKKESPTYYVSLLICLLQIIILFWITHDLKLILQNNRKNDSFYDNLFELLDFVLLLNGLEVDGNYFKIV